MNLELESRNGTVNNDESSDRMGYRLSFMPPYDELIYDQSLPVFARTLLLILVGVTGVTQ